MPYGGVTISGDCVRGERDGSGGKTGKAWLIGSKICQQWFNHIALRYAEPHV